jgi:hypothetical protein
MYVGKGRYLPLGQIQIFCSPKIRAKVEVSKTKASRIAYCPTDIITEIKIFKELIKEFLFYPGVAETVD